jgi:hypothetical protein
MRASTAGCRQGSTPLISDARVAGSLARTIFAALGDEAEAASAELLQGTLYL